MVLNIPSTFQNHAIQVQIAPAKIDLFNKLLEAYGHLALVSTIDAAQGLMAVWVTEDTRPAVMKILTKLPLRCQVIESQS